MSRPGKTTKRKRIVHDFMRRRLSMIGLARKYGMRVLEVEAVIRRRSKRR